MKFGKKDKNIDAENTEFEKNIQDKNITIKYKGTQTVGANNHSPKNNTETYILPVETHTNIAIRDC